MFVVAARYYAKQGADDEVAELLRGMIPHALAEPGCAVYTINRSMEDPRHFLLYEQYRDEQGYKDHMENEEFKRVILGQVVPLLESRERDYYITIDPSENA
jgi:quinol monooxygenase YgiN